MKFRTKKELLLYLGKDSNDRKLIDRMMMKGDVRMENGMYIYEDKGVEVDELKKEIKNLTEKVEQLEYQLDGANRSMGENYNEIIHRIYVYLKEVLHLNVRYDDLVEFIENYPSD